MTFEEKAKFLSRHLHPIQGVSDWAGGVAGSERLFYPPIQYNSGPQGFKDRLHHGTSTAFPSMLALASTWDKELAE